MCLQDLRDNTCAKAKEYNKRLSKIEDEIAKKNEENKEIENEIQEK